MHPATITRWLGVGASIDLPELPRGVPLVVAVARARLGRPLVGPLDSSETIAACRAMMAKLEEYVPVMQAIAEKFGGTMVVEQAGSPSTTDTSPTTDAQQRGEA